MKKYIVTNNCKNSCKDQLQGNLEFLSLSWIRKGLFEAETIIASNKMKSKC